MQICAALVVAALVSIIWVPKRYVGIPLTIMLMMSEAIFILSIIQGGDATIICSCIMFSTIISAWWAWYAGTTVGRIKSDESVGGDDVG